MEREAPDTNAQPDKLPRGLAVPWYGALTFLVLLTLYTFSAPLGYFLPLLLLMLAWPVYGGTVAVGYIISAVRRRSLRPRRAHWIPAVVIAITATAVLLNAPLLARYAASRPAMNGLLADAERDPKSIENRTRVGLWAIDRPHAYEGGVRFIVRGTGFLDRGGFAYSATGRPPDIEGDDDHYEHLHGNWYTWYEFW